MLPNKPYLIRSFYEWITDSSCTPYIIVNANSPNCSVPSEYIENGEITFNISSIAVRDLKISNDLLEFRASFSGMVQLISVPIHAILAIYAYENEEGLFFDYEDEDENQNQKSFSEVASLDNKHFSLISGLKPPEENNNNKNTSKDVPYLKLVE